MTYALIENGIATNIIYLHPMNADEFPNAVEIGDLPIQIGDSYADGKFFRDGKEITITQEQIYTLDQAANLLAQEVANE